MAKRNVVSRTFRSTRKTLNRYFSPGAKSAEATIEQLLDVLGEARASLRKLGASKKRKTRPTSTRRKTAAKSAAKRKVRRGSVAVRKRGAPRRTRPRKSARS
jgi:hypothetical protein